MADTARTLAALQALFADNTTGDVSPQYLRDFLVSALGGYGFISVLDGSTADAGISATPKLVTGFTTNGVAKDTTPDFANNQITVGVAGDYVIKFQMSFSGTASRTFLFRARVNGAVSVLGCSRKLGTGGDVGSCSFEGSLILAADDVVTVYVESTDGGSSITSVDAQLQLNRAS